MGRPALGFSLTALLASPVGALLLAGCGSSRISEPPRAAAHPVVASDASLPPRTNEAPTSPPYDPAPQGFIFPAAAKCHESGDPTICDSPRLNLIERASCRDLCQEYQHYVVVEREPFRGDDAIMGAAETACVEMVVRSSAVASPICTYEASELTLESQWKRVEAQRPECEQACRERAQSAWPRTLDPLDSKP